MMKPNAKKIFEALSQNAQAWMDNAISWEMFDAQQKSWWRLAESKGLAVEVRDLINAAEKSVAL